MEFNYNQQWCVSWRHCPQLMSCTIQGMEKKFFRIKREIGACQFPFLNKLQLHEQHC